MRHSELMLLENDIVAYMEEYMGVEGDVVHNGKDFQRQAMINKIKTNVETAKSEKNINSALKAATLLSSAVTGGTIVGSDSNTAKLVSAGITAAIAGATALHDKFSVKDKKEKLAKDISDELEKIDGAINSSKGEKRALLIVRDTLKNALKDVTTM